MLVVADQKCFTGRSAQRRCAATCASRKTAGTVHAVLRADLLHASLLLTTRFLLEPVEVGLQAAGHRHGALLELREVLRKGRNGLPEKILTLLPVSLGVCELLPRVIVSVPCICQGSIETVKLGGHLVLTGTNSRSQTGQLAVNDGAP